MHTCTDAHPFKRDFFLCGPMYYSVRMQQHHRDITCLSSGHYSFSLYCVLGVNYTLLLFTSCAHAGSSNLTDLS